MTSLCVGAIKYGGSDRQGKTFFTGCQKVVCVKNLDLYSSHLYVKVWNRNVSNGKRVQNLHVHSCHSLLDRNVT